MNSAIDPKDPGYIDLDDSEPSGQEVPSSSSDSQASSDSTEITAVRSASGPHTALGKERSKHNALKHGIFSKVVVLKDESKADFDSLLDGLREHYQPEGTLEETLVEKVAALLWRQRRLLVAEGAEIQMGAEFLEWNEEKKIQTEMERRSDSDLSKSDLTLLDRIENPSVLSYCVGRLLQLRKSVMANGLSLKDHHKILFEFCREFQEDFTIKENLSQAYERLQLTSEIPDDERKRKGYATPEQCKYNMIQRIDFEIIRLKEFHKNRTTMERSRMEIEKLCLNVPENPRAERLLRYEASLERAFDRTLTQLERIQRMRKGQFVPPPIRVDVSS